MFIVMKFIDSKQVRQIVGATGPVAPSDAITIRSIRFIRLHFFELNSTTTSSSRICTKNSTVML
jgi:hypothetical protein